MTDATLIEEIDNKVGELEQALCDILGIPINTDIAAAAFEIIATGLKKIILQDAASDPNAAGQLLRNGAFLHYHDGSTVRRLARTTDIPPASIGQVCTNNPGSPNTKFDLSATLVALRNPSTGGVMTKYNTGVITNDTGLAGSAANGRDQAGAFGADTWIHLYWIANESTLATLSSTVAPPTGPTLPAGYTHWCYAGAVRITGGNLVLTHIMGGKAFYQGLVEVLAAGVATVETAVDLSVAVPPNALDVQIYAEAFPGAGPFANLIIRYISGVNFMFLNPQGTSTYVCLVFQIPNIGQQIYYGWNAAPSGGVKLVVQGYSLPNGGS